MAEQIWQTCRNEGELRARDRLHEVLSALPKHRQRTVLNKIDKIIRREKRALASEEREVKRKMDILTAIRPELDHLGDWCDAPFILERPIGTCVHHAMQAISDGKIYLLSADTDYNFEAFSEALDASNCFVVEHDWAKAFSNAGEYSEGEIRLPYDVCSFDFKISGRRVIALMTTDPDSDDILMQILVRGAEFWLIDDDVSRHQNGKWEPIGSGRSASKNMFQGLTEFIGDQVRAIAVALDAQVAQSDPVRVSEKLVKARQRNGSVPPKSFHIVSLANRSRCASVASGEDSLTRKVRLHFRRGHWRHYEDHKTWIRWMLVGDPDLGFVDKNYRL